MGGMFSTKGRYALRVMGDLASHDGWVSLGDIAKREEHDVLGSSELDRRSEGITEVLAANDASGPLGCGCALHLLGHPLSSVTKAHGDLTQ